MCGPAKAFSARPVISRLSAVPPSFMRRSAATRSRTQGAPKSNRFTAGTRPLRVYVSKRMAKRAARVCDFKSVPPPSMPSSGAPGSRTPGAACFEPVTTLRVSPKNRCVRRDQIKTVSRSAAPRKKAQPKVGDGSVLCATTRRVTTRCQLPGHSPGFQPGCGFEPRHSSTATIACCAHKKTAPKGVTEPPLRESTALPTELLCLMTEDGFEPPAY